MLVRHFLLSMSIYLALFSACMSSKSSSDEDFSKFTKATVIDYREVSGCGFLLQLEDGHKLQATALPKKFEHDGLLVWIQYTVKNTNTICQAGKVIDLTEIRKR